MADLVIDTDVVSFGFRGDSRFMSYYGPAIQGARLILSFMTLAELQYGAMVRGWGEKRQNELNVFLARNFVQYGASRELCREWALLVAESKNRGRVLHTADAWIAATATLLGIPLVTHNQKDFAHLSRLKLISFLDQ